MTNLESRRSFLKKAAYVAPVVLAMGPLASQASVAGSKIYTNTTIGTSVQAGSNGAIVVTNTSTGATTSVSSSPSLSNFSNFLRRPR